MDANILIALQKKIIAYPEQKEYWLVYADFLQSYNIFQGDCIQLHFAYQNAREKEIALIIQQIESIVQNPFFDANYWPSFQDTSKDSATTPEMMVIPAGAFNMGSPKKEEGRREDEILHNVCINKPFALSKYTITFAEYDDYCKISQKVKPEDMGWGRDNHPVINVSWFDAQYYCDWLSEQTKQYYRLPTEAEWEYACRANTSTPYWWGEYISSDQANYYGKFFYNNQFQGRFYDRTLVVKSFLPNPWGLYQMHGNVSELCNSIYHSIYDGQRENTVTKPKDLELHYKRIVLRGGSWAQPDGLRSACRDVYSAFRGSNEIGFRVVREF